MKKVSGDDSPLRQGAGKSFRTIPSRIDNGGGLQYVFWKIDRGLRVFSPRRIYRQKGDARRWARWPHHLVARARGRLRHPMVRLPSGPLRLCFGLHLMSGEIGTLAFVLSNFENISYVTCLKHKNSRKQGTGTVESR
jgi:hypothetical protein